MIGINHQACPYSLRRRLSHRSNHDHRSHIRPRIYMMGRHRRACPYNRRHMGQVLQEDELLLGGWWLSEAEHLLVLVRLVGKSCSRTHSVSSHHPTQEVDHWEHRASRIYHRWNRLQIPRRFHMIGSHHWPRHYSQTHSGQVQEVGDWCLTTEAEELLMLVMLMGKSCSRTHSVSSHHPTQGVDHGEHRASRIYRRWNRLQIPRRFHMIGSHHWPRHYSQIHRGQVQEVGDWCLTTEAEELLMVVMLMGKSCSRTHRFSSHHPTQGVDHGEHRACRENDHWNRLQISRRFCTIGSHHRPCRYSPRHISLSDWYWERDRVSWVHLKQWKYRCLSSKACTIGSMALGIGPILWMMSRGSLLTMVYLLKYFDV